MINKELYDKYGTVETNSIPKGYLDEELNYMDFDELKKTDRIKLIRLRLLTDSYLPFYDVSYIHVLVNGKKTELTNFPHQIPKRGAKKYLVGICKEQGIFIDGLCDSRSNWSVLY